MINSAYFREREPYSKNQIAERLGIANTAKAQEVIERLLACNILKLLKQGQQLTASEVILAGDFAQGDAFVEAYEQRYVFAFVGLLQFEDYLLKCYPKYMASNLPSTEDMKLLVNVLERYNAEQFVIQVADDNEIKLYYNPLAINIYLLRDYFEYGIYANSRDYLEAHGNGEIEWEATLNEVIPILKYGKPYYADYYTRETFDDDSNYISRLHECLITLASQKIIETELDEMLEIETPKLYEGDLSDFGDQEFIEVRILQEMNTQFVTHKQILLRTMYAMVQILHNQMAKTTLDESNFSLFGTSSFNMVWEKMCSEVFANQYRTPFKALPFVVKEEYRTHSGSLEELIPKPKWEVASSGTTHLASDTLTPDIVTFVPWENPEYFVIMDAKYYDITLNEKGVSGQPGIGDINKQYLYQLAFSNFISDHNLKCINTFLCPSASDSITLLGTATMPIFDILPAIMASIKVIQLPAREMMTHYLNNTKINLSERLPALFAEMPS